MFTQFITILILVSIVGCILYGRRLIRTEKVDAVFGNPERAKHVANKIRAGQISINGGRSRGPSAPFGGFKTSGNGREHGMLGLHECLETKAIIGS